MRLEGGKLEPRMGLYGEGTSMKQCYDAVLAHGGTSTPLASHYANDVNYYEISNEERSDPLEKFYLIREQRWHTDTVLPIPLLPSTEGMSARSHHR
ncbi:uncharacterized protein LOC113464925 isoform X2 [Ceratina calcarata]|uniref:Uncharacterized protein LOC113464925 isoform X2 n=1 Tax=Ceratina calcarata TaxID=156304 RepID=A0AAJ7WEI9_9HYME|nr:uncharacterized protein LOC113464925 isoform X2 [Ceratina calcarata]